MRSPTGLDGLAGRSSWPYGAGTAFNSNNMQKTLTLGPAKPKLVGEQSVAGASGTPMERTRDEVVRILHDRAECSVAELAAEIGVSHGSIRRHMDLMVADGIVSSHLVRQSRGRPVNRYRLSEAGEEQTSAEHYQRLLSRLSPALATSTVERPPAGATHPSSHHTPPSLAVNT